MSKPIATRAIRGAYKLVERAEREIKQAIDEKGAGTAVEFPNTGYFLPISHGILGMRIDTLGGLKDLLAGLDGAGPGHDRQLRPANRAVADVDPSHVVVHEVPR